MAPSFSCSCRFPTPCAARLLPRRLRLLLSLLPLLLAGGCGYQQGTLYRQDVRTVAVPLFTNRTYERGIEIRLTHALIKRLEAHSPYKVVSRDVADTILEGEVTQIGLRTLSKDVHTNLPREQALTLTVDVVWKDLRSGQILRERRDLAAGTVYYPQAGEGAFAGTQEAVERLALSIVQEMQADW